MFGILVSFQWVNVFPSVTDGLLDHGSRIVSLLAKEVESADHQFFGFRSEWVFLADSHLLECRPEERIEPAGACGPNASFVVFISLVSLSLYIGASPVRRLRVFGLAFSASAVFSGD
ncbi:hypothetical protein [Fimbriiglobus ruber]|uniref:hypothetical protein n=1 Tax=Fimbriiglobus ruber TaxID=1908690 RepID=UPI000B4B924B|nr:hypothetical protein [Fimbriiglobus ruber]